MPNTKRCFCDDWENFAKYVLLSTRLIKTAVRAKRDGVTIEDWEFVPDFKFCPWCGSPLAGSEAEPAILILAQQSTQALRAMEWENGNES